MGWFDGRSEVGSDRHGHSHHSSSGKRHSSSQSIFGLGGDDHYRTSHHNSSSRSFFGSGRSHKRASPRRGYISKMYHQLRRLLRDLIYYMKRNPLKVFMLVIMPLITGGALTGLLSRFGVRLPLGLERMIAKLGGGSGTSIGRGRDGGLQFERKRYEGPLEGMGSVLGGMGGAGNLLSVAKMFL